jgi:catechol 2,3-dioxygenase-like lactoylglutathione lyase family enzyme
MVLNPGFSRPNRNQKPAKAGTQSISNIGEKTMNAINTLKAHLAINVSDVETSIDFYKRMFGIEPSKVRTGYAKFDVADPPLNFTLNQVAFEGSGALSHLGIQVAGSEDVIAMRDDWKERGLEPREEMQTTCCYALQDKAWVNDPDGNEWEVFAVLEDNLAEAKSNDASCCVPTFAGIEGKKEVAATSCC